MALRTPAFNDAKTYGFEWLRYLLEVGDVQEGVLNAGDLKVTPGTGGGMNVDVAAGTAFIKGDSGIPGVGLSQGLYLAVNDANIANAVALPASNATNPRLDQVCLRVRDSTDLSANADDLTVIVVAGVATAGATLDNRAGSAALPNDHIRLADVLVPAASASVTAGNIRDRRAWARGAYSVTRFTGGGSYTPTASAGPQVLDTTNYQVRAELAGQPVRLSASGLATRSVTGSSWDFAMDLDGTIVGVAIRSYVYSTTFGGGGVYNRTTAVAAPNNTAGQSSVASGSHLIRLLGGNVADATGGTVAILGGANAPEMVVEELIRPNTTNGTT